MSKVVVHVWRVEDCNDGIDGFSGRNVCVGHYEAYRHAIAENKMVKEKNRLLKKLLELFCFVGF